MPMKNPPHPGLSVKQDCLDALSLTVTAAAKLLGVTRQTLNDLVHARRDPRGVIEQSETCRMPTGIDAALRVACEVFRKAALSPADVAAAVRKVRAQLAIRLRSEDRG